MRRLSEPSSSAAPLTRQHAVETFEELNVTVSNLNATEVASQNLGIVNQTGSENLYDFTGELGGLSDFVPDWGIILAPTTALGRVDFDFLTEDDVGDFVVERVSDGVELFRESMPDQTVYSAQVEELFSPGEEYRVYGETGGDFHRGREIDLPISNSAAEVVAGSENGSRVTDSIGPVIKVDTYEIPTAGSATVEIDQPQAVSAWDIASVHRIGSGSVDVYIEESQDGGQTWSRVQGPLSGDEEIQASADAQIRFDVEFQRESSDDDPRLVGLYRRWVVGQ